MGFRRVPTIIFVALFWEFGIIPEIPAPVAPEYVRYEMFTQKNLFNETNEKC